MTLQIREIPGIRTAWGESARWDEQRGRLYFVDCVSRTLHWLSLDDDGRPTPDVALETRKLPSVPTGMVLCRSGALVIALEDGLHVVDPDRGTSDLLATYPAEMRGRANDLCADFDNHLITGKLNLGPAEGSAWWYSAQAGWKRIDDRISNTNGPGVAVLDGEATLVIGDTSADYYAYPYDADTGTVGERRTFGAMDGDEGRPDGSAFDSEGGLWCALVGGGCIARFTTAGLDRRIELPVRDATDVAFAGPDLDRLFVTTIGVARGDATPEPEAGALFVVDGLGVRGRVEPRFDA